MHAQQTEHRRPYRLVVFITQLPQGTASRPPSLDLIARWLSPEEVHRIHRFRRTADKWSFVVGRALTRLLLHKHAEITHAKLVVPPRGKPLLERSGDEQIDLSISHEGDWIAAAVAFGCRIGIDVSTADHFQDWQQFAKSYLQSAEQLHVSSLNTSDQPEEACRLWTAKEAIVKATGHGFSVDPKSVGLETKRLTPQVLPPELPQPQTYSVFYHCLRSARLSVAIQSGLIMHEHVPTCELTEISFSALQ